jgi:sugar phosphate isomerase/epimerase
MSETGIKAKQALTDRLGVFLNCTGRQEPAEAIAAATSLGLSVIQVGKLPDRFYSPAAAGAAQFRKLMDAAGVRAASAVIAFDGESYTDWNAVANTVGYRPAKLLKARLEYSRGCVDFAAELGAPLVTTHMGILPKDEKDPLYQRLLGAVREVAAHCAKRGVGLSLETGQETAEELARFLDRLSEYRVGVNFDTANLILYGLGDSPGALAHLVDKVTSVHVKDGLPPRLRRRGALGVETRLGEGRAEVAKCLGLLDEAGFGGPLIIENYVASVLHTDPLDELRRARDFIQKTLMA